MVAEAGLGQRQAVAVGDLAAGRGDVEIERAGVGAGVPGRLDGFRDRSCGLSLETGRRSGADGRKAVGRAGPSGKPQAQHGTDSMEERESTHHRQI